AATLLIGPPTAVAVTGAPTATATAGVGVGAGGLMCMMALYCVFPSCRNLTSAPDCSGLGGPRFFLGAGTEAFLLAVLLLSCSLSASEEVTSSSSERRGESLSEPLLSLCQNREEGGTERTGREGASESSASDTLTLFV